MNRSLAETLTEARDSLTPVNWRKGAYFKLENNALCMCAHGAVQMLVNPRCALKMFSIRDHISAAAASSNERIYRREHPFRAPLGEAVIWNNRPNWVKNDFVQDKINYGDLDAHYLLGMVGLTIGFNDKKSTTYEMVIEKFNEAIELATRLGV